MCTVPPPAAPEPDAGIAATSAPTGAGDAAVAAHAGRGPGAAGDAGTSDGGDGRGRAGVTLEQGDGWSLERWPAGAGARVSLDRAAQGALTDKGAKSGAGMVDLAVPDRSGSRGVA
jgi:hypothetical protein